jgi:ferredoxin
MMTISRPADEGADVKVQIDLQLCQGHGQCQDAAPDVFEVTDEGFARLLVDSSAIRDDQEAKVRDAASRCPVEAIRLSD